MRVSEFLQLDRKKDIQLIRAYNKILIEKYPWLKIKNYQNFDPYPEEYDWTWLDDMPEGWRIAFSEQMCKEIQEELERIDYVDKYRIVQVKEKYGGLCWYTDPVPAKSKLEYLKHKYENLSEDICIECGKPATLISKGWIEPYCDDCAKKFNIVNYIPIKEN